MATKGAQRRQQQRSTNQPPAVPQLPFPLEQLPDLALQLVCRYASTRGTPAACLLAQVSRSWAAAAAPYEGGAFITLELGCFNKPPLPPPAAARQRPVTRASAKAAAAAAAGAPAPAAAAEAAGDEGDVHPSAPYIPTHADLLAHAQYDAARLTSLAAWLKRPGRTPHGLVLFSPAHISDEVPRPYPQSVHSTYAEGVSAVLDALCDMPAHSDPLNLAAAAAGGGGSNPAAGSAGLQQCGSSSGDCADSSSSGNGADSDQGNDDNASVLKVLQLPVLGSTLLRKTAKALTTCGRQLQKLRLDRAVLVRSWDLLQRHVGGNRPTPLYAALRQLTQLTHLELDAVPACLQTRFETEVNLGPLLTSCPSSLKVLLLHSSELVICSMQLRDMRHLQQLQRLQLPSSTICHQSAWNPGSEEEEDDDDWPKPPGYYEQRQLQQQQQEEEEEAEEEDEEEDKEEEEEEEAGPVTLPALTAFQCEFALCMAAPILSAAPALQVLGIGKHLCAAAEVIKALQPATHVTSFVCRAPEDEVDVCALGEPTHLQQLLVWAPPRSMTEEGAPEPQVSIEAAAAWLVALRQLVNLQHLMLPLVVVEGLSQHLPTPAPPPAAAAGAGPAAAAGAAPAPAAAGPAAAAAAAGGSGLQQVVSTLPQLQRLTIAMPSIAAGASVAEEVDRVAAQLLPCLQQLLRLQVVEVAFSSITAEEEEAAVAALEQQLPGVVVEVFERWEWNVAEPGWDV